MKLPPRSFLPGLALAAGILSTPAFAAVNIDYALIGNAGNANDATGYGGVAYAYKIARNETTVSDYAQFLNAKAKSDPYGLYNANMGSDAKIAGITRSGTSGSYTYSVLTGSGNHPIAYVSWFDAARYCNWLHNAQGSGGTERGAYTLNGALSGVILKNSVATTWIPSESEWYKAAYYDPNKGGAGVGGYWARATQSDSLNGNTIGVAGAANYFDGDYVFTGTPDYPTENTLTDVGIYGSNSQSHYGTNDQAGSVSEWNDAVINASTRGLSGGAWGSTDFGNRSSARYNDFPTNERSYMGIRVASVVPEPTSLVLTMLAGSVMFARRKR